MPNVAGVLKAEISRVARRELRAEIDPLKKQLASQRTALAALKKQLQLTERTLRKATGRKEASNAPDAADEGPSIRFNAKGLASHRQRLGISAADMAKLLGVSSLSVYKWESGKTRPRRAQVEAIAQVRKLGKKEVRERLEVLEAAPPMAKRARRKAA